MSRRREPHGDVRPLHIHGPEAPPLPDEEPDLLDHVRERLQAGDQIGVVIHASMIVSALEPGRGLPCHDAQGDDGPSLAELVDWFIDVRAHEMTPVLAALAALVSDDVLRRRIRRELDRRGQPLPAGFDPLEPLSVDRTVVATHVLGHVERLVVGVKTAGGQPLTIVVTVDHELGSLATDGFAYPGPPEVAVTRLAGVDAPDVIVTDIAPADARAWIAEAIEIGRITHLPAESGTWPECRPRPQSRSPGGSVRLRWPVRAPVSR